MPFTALGLAPSIVRAVRDAGYETPTPIQEKAIPRVLEGRDLIGCAQTGTGKTAAFTLPLLNRLSAGARGRLRALVLTPTRELALQIHESIRTYGRHLPLRCAVVYGGVGYGPQEEALRRGTDIVVATPGRLLDHMQRRNVDFRTLEVLVLDEADRMLDMGFIRDVRRIIQALPKRRQTLLFSATMPDEIRRLSEEILERPETVEVAPRRSAPAQGVRQVVIPVAASSKRVLLARLLQGEVKGRVLVFTRTKHGANKLARGLEGQTEGVTVLHGNKSQAQRVRALGDFRSGRARVMIATDIAGRGLDVDGIEHIINFDLPNVPEDYVHRVGRTARAGATGDAISFMSPEERPHVRAIEALIGKPIERRTVEGLPAGDAGGGAARPSPFHGRAQGRPEGGRSEWRHGREGRAGGRTGFGGGNGGSAGRRGFASGNGRSGGRPGPGGRNGKSGGRPSLDALQSAQALAAPRASSGWRGRGIRRIP